MIELKGILAILIGSAGSSARLMSEYMAGTRPFLWWHLPATMLIGGFLGFMGGDLANTLSIPQWTNVFAGALGASGAYGFDMLIKRVEKQAGL